MPPVQDGRPATDGEVTVADQAHPSWRRVVLKLSGQAFGGDETLGISPDAVVHIAREISSAAGEGIQVAAVVGGGNMFRGATLAQHGIDRSRRRCSRALRSTGSTTPVPARCRARSVFTGSITVKCSGAS